MAIKKLFLCHPREAAGEVHRLAEALRLRGIVPWVDQQGGFSLGDGHVDEARRVIREECIGLLLYATREAFASDFIRRVELHEALHAKDDDAAFVLFALPRRIGFDELSRLSTAAFGVDLANFASRPLVAPGATAEGAALDALFAGVASDLVWKVLQQDPRRHGTTLQMQYSTRERLADEADDALRIDATGLFVPDREAVIANERWDRLHDGLRDVKFAVAACRGRPRLRVHGSKHLTAAFLFGYAFPSTAFELDLRTQDGYWTTDCPPSPAMAVRADLHEGSAASESLHVELSTLDQPVHDAVRRYIQRTGESPLASLRLTVDPATYGGLMGNAEACAIADQVRREIAQVVARQPIAEIQLFAAVPQALATMIGQRFNALPPIQLHEYDGREYWPSYLLRSVQPGL
jgi:hypothetical protein